MCSKTIGAIYRKICLKKSAATTISIVLLILLYFISSANTQELNKKFLSDEFKKPFEVKVTISESQISNLVKSFIKRELRSLGDVTIVESDPFYEINIIATTLKNKKEDIIGIAVDL